MTKSPPFVAFAGIAPTIGDTAIGQSILHGLKTNVGVPIHVHTNRPDVFGLLPQLGADDQLRPRVPALAPRPHAAHVLPFRLRTLLADLRRTGGRTALPPDRYAALRDVLEGCAALVFQGGPDWNDRMMDRRRVIERWLLLEAARYYGVRVYQVGVSCGPFGWRYPQRLWMAPLCRRALDRYDMLFVRDRFSRPALERLGVRARVVESTDAAVFLQAAADPRYAHVEARIRAADGRPRVVVSVRDYQPAYPDALKARDHALTALARALDRVQRDLANVFFLSTDHNPRPDKMTDLAVAARLQEMMTTPGSVVIDEDVANPAALKHIYGQFDAMISMRLHPTILALDLGVPALLLSYDAKCTDFFRSLALEEYVVPLEAFDPEAAVLHVATMLASPGLRDDIRQRVAALRRAHAADYEPMYAQIAARAQQLSESGRQPTAPAGGGPRVRQAVTHG